MTENNIFFSQFLEVFYCLTSLVSTHFNNILLQQMTSMLN